MRARSGLFVLTGALGAPVVLAGCAAPNEAVTSSTVPRVSSAAPPTATTTAPVVTSCSRPGSGLGGFEALSWTFASLDDGWALGTETAAGQSGCAVIARTTDGGASWIATPSPPAMAGGPSSCTASTCLSGLRFANVSDGYAFGSGLFTTTDGGSTWVEQPSPPVLALEAAGDRVFRIVSPCGWVGQCNDVVQSSDAGSGDWTTLPGPAEPLSELVLAGRSTVYLTANAGAAPAADFGDLWASGDGGLHWSHVGNPCYDAVPIPGSASAQGRIDGVAATGATVVVACASAQIAPQQAGYEQGVVVSHDDGRSFDPFLTIPHLPGFDGGSGLQGIALAGPSTIVVSGSEGGVQTSWDGGRTWTTTVAQPATYAENAVTGPVGFETSDVGHVVAPSDTMWTTTDAGALWSAHRFAS